MEFSQFAKEAIVEAERYSWDRHYDASRVFRNASEKAEMEHDQKILQILSDVLSMSFTEQEQAFSPMIQLSDGRRSFAICDIEGSDCDILESFVKTTTSVWMRAQVSHILWELTKNHKYGEEAVNCRIQLFNETLDEEHWPTCVDAIKPAIHVSKTLGKNTDSYRNVMSAIHNAIIALNGSDPLFLSISLIELVVADATAPELNQYLQCANNLAKKNICEANDNYHLAEETFSIQENILKHLQNKKEIQKAKIALAEYFVIQTKKLDANKDYLRAVMLAKKACTLYNGIDSNRLLELRAWLEKLQEKSVQNMQPIVIPYDTTHINQEIDALFLDLTIEEAIVQLGRITRIYHLDDIRNKVIQEQQQFIFKSLFGSSLLNTKGQTIRELAPLDREDPDSDKDLLFKHMVYYVSKQRSLESGTVLRYAIYVLKKIGAVSIDNLNFLIDNNPIVPEGREDIFKQGIYFGLSGNLYVAMHILLPQTENLIRNLVKLCGDTTTFLHADGTEDTKLLTKLFGSQKLKECYSEDIIFNLQSIMDNPLGENLRNLTAHGILSPEEGSSTKALSFLCLLIKLLSMYSHAAYEMMASIDSRSQNNTEDDA